MFKGSKAKHVRPRLRWAGPVFAVQAVLLALAGMRELDAATAAQLGEFAAEGAR